MMLLIAYALALWATVGPFVAPSITVESADGNPAYAQARPSLAWTNGNGTDACVITIWHLYFDQLPPAAQQDVITHEVGHCLGLSHIDPAEGVMTSTAGVFPFSDADRLEFLRVHPLPRQAFAVIN
jgi:hypothetical protein